MNEFYILKNENVTFNYSEGGCSLGEDWDVKKDTVVKIKIYPTETMFFSELKLDQTKLKESMDYSERGIFYEDKEKGITYRVRFDHAATVESISIHPAIKDEKRRCKKEN
jgi:hypothetical protein